MAEIPKHARYATQTLFDSAVSAGSVPSGAVCFIEDTRQIWVDGVYYTLDDAEIEEKVSAALGDYYTKDEVAKLIGDLDQEVKDVVSDVSGLKTEVAGKADAFGVGYGLALEDSVLRVTIDPSLFVVCPNGLPSEPADGEEDKIHLVPMEETEEGNAYEEWLWVNGAWELFGTLRTKVDLSNYLPLTGGTLTGKLTVNSQTVINGDLTVGGLVELTNDSGKLAVSIDSDAATTVHGDMTVEGTLFHRPDDEEDLADVEAVLGLGPSNNFVRVLPSQFMAGTSKTSVDVRCWVGDPDDSRCIVTYVRNGAAAEANFEEGGTVTADVWSVITVTGTHNGYVSQTVSYVVTSTLTNIELRLDEGGGDEPASNWKSEHARCEISVYNENNNDLDYSHALRIGLVYSSLESPSDAELFKSENVDWFDLLDYLPNDEFKRDVEVTINGSSHGSERRWLQGVLIDWGDCSGDFNTMTLTDSAHTGRVTVNESDISLGAESGGVALYRLGSPLDLLTMVAEDETAYADPEVFNFLLVGNVELRSGDAFVEPTIDWKFGGIGWEVSLVNEAEEGIGDPLEVGLCFSNNDDLTEASDFESEGEIVWMKLAESIGINGKDADGDINVSNFDARKWGWFGGIVLKTPTRFVTDQLRMHLSGEEMDSDYPGGFADTVVATWDGVEGNLQGGETIFLPGWTDLKSLGADKCYLTFLLAGQINFKAYNN